MNEDPRSAATTVSPARPLSAALRAFLLLGGLFLLGVLVWQAITAAGSPDPTAENTGRTTAVFDIAVLIFREALETILVLAAILASLIGPNRAHKKPIVAGVGVGFVATIITWFVAVGIVDSLADNVSALNLQAATGLLAIVVLLVVMNWFFHKVYWGGWIAMHHRRKRELLKEAHEGGGSPSVRRKLLLGLGLLGFASLYREGFEVVLFLQTYRLKLGGAAVLEGTLVGLFLSSIVAVLTFVAHRKLPYRQMLVLTGVLLGGVLLVMVGEQAQEMQLANWIPTTPVPALKWMPDWAGVWFALFPTVETLLAQGIAAVLVVGSFFLAKGRSAAEAEVAK